MSGTPMGDKMGVGGGQQSPSMQSHGDPLASLTGPMGGQSAPGQMGKISPNSLNDIRSFMAQHTGTGEGQVMAPPGMSPMQGLAPTRPAQPAPVPSTPNPIAQGAQQGATAGLTAGLGAGDAAAAAARASAIPGGASADALSGMMQGIGDQTRAAIQQKIDMMKKMMGGG